MSQSWTLHDGDSIYEQSKSTMRLVSVPITYNSVATDTGAHLVGLQCPMWVSCLHWERK